MSVWTIDLPSGPWYAQVVAKSAEMAKLLNTANSTTDYLDGINVAVLRHDEQIPDVPVSSDFPGIKLIEGRLRELDGISANVDAIEVPQLTAAPNEGSLSSSDRQFRRVAITSTLEHVGRAARGLSVLRRGVGDLERLIATTQRISRAVRAIAAALQKILDKAVHPIAWDTLGSLWLDAETSISQSVNRLASSANSRRDALARALDTQRLQIRDLAGRTAAALQDERVSIDVVLNAMETERNTLNDLSRRAWDWRDELQALADKVAELDEQISASRKQLAGDLAELDQRTRKLSDRRSRLNTVLEELRAPFVCPAGYSWDDCTSHPAAKDAYLDRQRELRNRRDELRSEVQDYEQRVRTLREAIEQTRERLAAHTSARTSDAAQLAQQRPQFNEHVRSLQERWQRVFGDAEYNELRLFDRLNIADRSKLEAFRSILESL